MMALYAIAWRLVSSALYKGMNKPGVMAALKALTVAAVTISCSVVYANNNKPDFRVIAFFTGKQDQAHISFLREAERWFPQMAAKYNFGYDTTSNWDNLNSDFLSEYQVVVFLDTRPEKPAQRESEVVAQIAHEADAVGVVGEPAIGVEAQRVRSLRERRAFGRPARGVESIELERHRDVAALRAARSECSQRRLERVERNEQAFIRDRLAGLAREFGMDERRLAVLDRVAGDDVAVHVRPLLSR